MALIASAFCISFFVWLVSNALASDTLAANVFSQTWWLALLFALVALGNELIRTPLILTLAYTAVMSRKPVPVVPHTRKRSILLIPFVPKSEDSAQLEKTLIAAKRIKGLDAILVLDEGLKGAESPVKPLVNFLNQLYDGPTIIYFCRAEHRVYANNARRGKKLAKPGKKEKLKAIKSRLHFKDGQKYGNINAGLHYLRRDSFVEEYGSFDIVMGIDHDHVPVEGFVERMLGYFNDPDVAYVIGPQSYANARNNRVAQMAETNQSVFHTQIQAAPNRGGGAMFVGTNFAIRDDVLLQIKDIQASQTEDLATTFAVLSRRNQATGNYWRSVYTPDVLAHGEGPKTFGDFYIQQNRWASGAMEYLRSPAYWSSLARMWRRPVVLFHYLSIMAFYPIMAMSWLLAGSNILLQMVFGANGQIVDPNDWLLFYGWTTFMSIMLYARMRRYNTSPFEKPGTPGISGMLMGVMTIPIFASALVKTLLFIPNKRFEVTPKGAKSTGDRLFTFRLNLGWAVFYTGMIVAGFASHNLNPINFGWSLFALIILMAPIAIWKKTAPATVKPELESDPIQAVTDLFRDLEVTAASTVGLSALLDESEA